MCLRPHSWGGPQGCLVAFAMKALSYCSTIQQPSQCSKQNNVETGAAMCKVGVRVHSEPYFNPDPDPKLDPDPSLSISCSFNG